MRTPGICDLADKHDALVMVDDSHAAVHGRPAAAPTNTAAPPNAWHLAGTLGSSWRRERRITSGRREIPILPSTLTPGPLSNTSPP